MIVESGAGEQAGYPDAAFVEKGARIVPDRAGVFRARETPPDTICPKRPE